MEVTILTPTKPYPHPPPPFPTRRHRNPFFRPSTRQHQIPFFSYRFLSPHFCFLLCFASFPGRALVNGLDAKIDPSAWSLHAVVRLGSCGRYSGLHADV